jgi:hypothetical protein
MDKPRKNWDSNIWLYAKGHYFVADIVEDLKVIMSDRCYVQVEHVHPADIVSVLLGIVWPLIKQNDNRFFDFVLGLDPDQAWKVAYGDESDPFHRRLIAQCLSVIRLTRVQEDDKVLVELDDPDPTLLPLSRSLAKGNMDLPFCYHRMQEAAKANKELSLFTWENFFDRVGIEMQHRFDSLITTIAEQERKRFRQLGQEEM